MNYIPAKDAELLLWGANFAAKLVGDPTRYGITAAEAALLDTEFTAFAQSMNVASDPASRCPASVAHKDALKALFIGDARTVAGIIRGNRGISNEDKAALGLTIPDPVRTPTPEPTSAPVFNILGSTPGNHTITFQDPDQPDVKAKPFGVTHVLVYRRIDTVPHDDFDAADPRLCTVLTKTPALLDIPNGNRGKIATYWAQWLSRTGLLGPLSNATSFACP